MKPAIAIALALLVAVGLSRPALAQSAPYANPQFAAALSAALRSFYTRDFAAALAKFQACLAIDPGEPLALAFENATLLHIDPLRLQALAAKEEADAARAPRNALAQTRLGFTDLFLAQSDSSRADDARAALDEAIAVDPQAVAAHVGLGIYRYGLDERSRAKAELLAALAADPHDVLAREYLSSIYQKDLQDPNRALDYLIDVPNVVPQYADAFYHLGSIFDDLGQYDAAVRYLRTAIDMDSGHVGEAGQDGLPLLGRIYLKIHHVEDAKRAFAEAVVFGEEPEFSQSQLDKIKRGLIK